MRFSHFAAAALAMLCVSSCVSMTVPPGSSAGFHNDPALTGLWKGKIKPDEPDTYFRVTAKPDNTTAVLMTRNRDGERKAGWMSLVLTTATLGGHRYMTIEVTGTSDSQTRPKPDPSAKKLLLYGLYVVTGDTFTFRGLDKARAKSAIRAHQIAGNIAPIKMGETVVGEAVAITADGPQLDAFLATPAGAALFAGDPPMILHRVEKLP